MCMTLLGVANITPRYDKQRSARVLRVNYVCCQCITVYNFGDCRIVVVNVLSIIWTITGMETHMEEQVMVRNCCLSLCQFEIPQEILFDYRLVISGL